MTEIVVLTFLDKKYHLHSEVSMNRGIDDYMELAEGKGFKALLVTSL